MSSKVKNAVSRPEVRLLLVGLALLLVSLSLLLIAQSLAATESGNTAQSDIFSHNDHLLISRSIAEGSPHVAVILAVDADKTKAIAQSIRAVDGSIRFEADELGYIRTVIPVRALPNLEAMTGINLANISPPNQFDVELNGIPPVRRVEQDHAPSSKPDGLPTPSASTTKVNDFTGVGEVGAAQFIKAHPTFDGRGVRIAIFEPVEPDLPYLQKARDIDGRLVPKLAGIQFTTNPAEIDAKTRHKMGWVDMTAVVTAIHGSFRYQGRVYKAPHDGRYRVGVLGLKDLWAGEYYHNTEHPHGTAFDKPLDYAVLWDTVKNFVWVDTHQDGNFSGQNALSDYARRPSYGVLHLYFGWWNTSRFFVFDKPALAPDQFPFVVQTDNRLPSQVRISLMLDDHAAMVASSAAGQGFFDGAFDGMAPGAQILSYDQGDDYPYTLESMILAARQHADIMSLQFGVDFNFDNGHDVWDEIEHRIVQQYHTIIAVSADNAGPTMTTVDTPSSADGVFSIGGYVRGRRILLLYGSPVFGTDYIADYSSRGPRGDGGLKPDFLAPTEWLAGSAWVAPHGILRRGVQLPSGYDIGGGTSQACPSAAGAIAVLLSAAKQSHISYTPELIYEALAESARVLPGYQAYEQGNGLLNIPGAWEALQRLSAANTATVDRTIVTSEAPVITARSAELPTPGRGVGLYDRLVLPRIKAQRKISLTRTMGAVDAETFMVRWLQNDGTFQSAPSVTLPLGTTVDLPVTVSPKASGPHSAILEVIDPQTGAAVARVLNTVIAADQFTAQNGFTIHHTDFVPHPGVTHYFFNVPPGTDLLRIALKTRHSDTVEFFKTWTSLLVDVHQPDGTKPALENALEPYHDGDYYARAYPKPMSGTWEVAINNETPSLRYADTSRHVPLPAAQVTFSASVYAIKTLAASRDSRGRYTLRLQNLMAPIHPKASSSDLGFARRSTLALSPARPLSLIQIKVPAKTSEVEVTATAVDPQPAADPDIFLFNCAKNVGASKAEWVYQGACEYEAGGNRSTGGIATTSMPAGGEGQMLNFEPTPVAGNWIAVIDGSEHITGAMVFRIATVLKSNRLGKALTTVQSAFVPSGGRFTAIVRTNGKTGNAAGIYIRPTIKMAEADTISETLPSTLNAEKLLKAKPIVTHTYTPIWLQPIPK